MTKYGQSTQNKKFQCQVCNDYHTDSMIDIKEHIMNQHEFTERLDALVEKVYIEEDTEKGYG